MTEFRMPEFQRRQYLDIAWGLRPNEERRVATMPTITDLPIGTAVRVYHGYGVRTGEVLRQNQAWRETTVAFPDGTENIYYPPSPFDVQDADGNWPPERERCEWCRHWREAGSIEEIEVDRTEWYQAHRPPNVTTHQVCVHCRGVGGGIDRCDVCESYTDTAVWVHIGPVTERLWCVPCAVDSTEECEHCGVRFSSDYGSCPGNCGDPDTCNCADCREERWSRLPCRCYYCREGRRPRAGEVWPYEHTPELVFRGDNDGYHLGIENELGFNSNPSELIHDDGTYSPWLYCKHDGSVRGMEVVSHPTTHDGWKSSFPHEIWDTLKEHGTGASARHGMHVHIGKQALEDEDHYVRWHMFIYASKPNGTLIESRREKIMQIMRREPTGYCEFYAMGETAARRKYRDGDNDHGEAINSGNEHTHEVRIFQGTFERREVMASIEFVKATVEFTRDHEQAECTWKNFARFVAQHEDTYTDLQATMVSLGIAASADSLVVAA